MKDIDDAIMLIKANKIAGAKDLLEELQEVLLNLKTLNKVKS